MVYTVKKLAKLSGISVRTLHYYDHIGLLKPSRNDANGYRLYGEGELLKLQQILFFRELEFPLREIQRIIGNPAFDPIRALADHKELLLIRKRRLDGLIASIDETVNNLEGGGSMADDDMYSAFSDEEFNKYRKEAKERWGNTAAYKQSQERMKGWTRADFDRIAKEGDEVTRAIAALMDKGPGDSDVQKLTARHYRYISVFYDCPYAMYRNLGQMYVDDPRFTAFYEKYRPGLAVFMRDAMAIFAGEKLKGHPEGPETPCA